MSLLWIDGFDHYGDVDRFGARLRDGVYAETNLGVGGGVVTDNPRTGTHSLRIQMGQNDAGVRRVILHGAQTTVGAGFAFSISSLPTDNRSLGLFQWRDDANLIIGSVWVTSAGQISLVDGGRSGPELARSSPVVYADAYQHFEAVMTPAGFEVRLNGVTVINHAIAGGECAQVKVGSDSYPLVGAVGILMDVDDFSCWDGGGALNNDFIGDVKVYTRMPDADGPVQEWAPASGSDGFAMIDNVPPLDATEYLEAEVVTGGSRSEFGVADFPAEVVSVRGVMLATRAWKTDAGDATLGVGVTSGPSEVVETPHNLSQAPVWYSDVFEVDPDTGVPWTLAGINGLGSIIERND